MNLNKMIMLSALALSLTGCMTVEGMRAKLNSGDPKLVAEAEQEIVRAAIEWDPQSLTVTPQSTIIECFGLIENNKALYDVIDSRKAPWYLRAGAIKAVKVKDDRDVIQVFEKYAEWEAENGSLYEAEYAKGEYIGLTMHAIDKAQKSSTLYACLAAIKRDEQSIKIANRLCEIETNQLVLAELACNLNGWRPEDECEEKAGNRITEIPAKLKLLERDEYHERVLRSLSEAEVVDDIIGAVDRDTYEKELRAVNASKPDMGNGEFGAGKEKGALAISKPTQVKCYRIPDGVDLIKYVNDQKMLAKIVLEAKYIPATSYSSRNYRKEAAEKLTDKKYKLALIKRLADVWAAGKSDENTEDLLMILATEQDGLLMWVEKLDKCNGLSCHKTLIERITDSKVADMMFDKMSLSIYKEMELLSDEGVIHSSKRFEIIEKLFSKMSKEKKASLLKGALERSKSVAHRVNFEGFYVGMPLIDFYLLREHYGISVGYKGYKLGKENVWHNNLFVSALQFSLHACQKFLDCEDSKILYQTIHKYVMHKEGKANVLAYMGLIKHEIEDASTSSFNIWTGTTSTDYEFKNWETYSNSKLNTKIWFSVKAGILQFTGL